MSAGPHGREPTRSSDADTLVELALGNLPPYPFGTAMDDTEQRLAAALEWL